MGKKYVQWAGSVTNRAVWLHFLMLLLVCFFIQSSGCQRDGVTLNDFPYRNFIGYRKGDTTYARIRMTKTDFYGTMEVWYERGLKDSGTVKGKIIADTLFIGDYHYMHDGQQQWARAPLRFLFKNGRLIRGEGVVSYFMNLPFFIPDVPVSFDPGKQFVLLEKSGCPRGDISN